MKKLMNTLPKPKPSKPRLVQLLNSLPPEDRLNLLRNAQQKRANLLQK